MHYQTGDKPPHSIRSMPENTPIPEDVMLVVLITQVRQRRSQQGGIGATRGGGFEHQTLALAQALRDVALACIG